MHTVSIMLIVAIIACPLGCSNGFCQGHGNHFLSNSVEACIVDEFDCCAQSPSHERRSPSNRPCKTLCPGICGGAVLERPIDLSEGLDTFSNLETIDHPTARHREHSNIQRAHQPIFPGDRNVGRSLRTLHESLLI